MVEDPNACKRLFDRILAKLVSTKHFSSDFVDKYKQQYSAFLQIIVKADEASFPNFDIDSTSLDVFLTGYMKDSACFKLIDIAKSVLILSYYQSSVQQDFRVNKNLLVENLQESSLIPECLVLDHMSANCFEPYTFPM